MRVLVSWIGNSDLVAAFRDNPRAEPGPVLRLLLQERFDRIHFLNDLPEGDGQREKASPAQFEEWLSRNAHIDASAVCRVDCEPLRNDYDRAYGVTRDWLQQIRNAYPATTRFVLLLSPGLAAAQVAMVIAAQTVFHHGQVELFNTSKERGCEPVHLPYLLSVDVVSSALGRWQRRLPDGEIHSAFKEIRGSSRAIQTAKQMASLVARYRSVNVLLRGESGTGKELFARRIHLASSRAGKPFTAVNCAAIPRELLESELFGHVKGAFTGASRDREGLIAAANGGTVFLDEIGDMPAELQAKLLRFLQGGTFTPVGSSEECSADARIVAATHRDLDQAIRAGQFRGDLFYRLDQVSIPLPPLRERGQDVRALAEYALEAFYTANQVPEVERKRLTDESLAALQQRPWPGNVRELQNAVTRLAVFAPGREVTAQDVADWLGPVPQEGRPPLRDLDAGGLFNLLAAVVDELLERWGKQALPEGMREDANIFDSVIQPLVRGRALALCGSAAAAERLLGTTFDHSKEPDRKRLQRYEAHMKPLLREDHINRVRGYGS
jgi:DNA-binding NtrC family response regulator